MEISLPTTLLLKLRGYKLVTKSSSRSLWASFSYISQNSTPWRVSPRARQNRGLSLARRRGKWRKTGEKLVYQLPKWQLTTQSRSRHLVMQEACLYALYSTDHKRYDSSLRNVLARQPPEWACRNAREDTLVTSCSRFSMQFQCVFAS